MRIGSFKAGVAQVEIACPTGVPLAGHLAARWAEGQATPLLARALVLDDGQTQLAIASLDLFGLPGGAARRVAGALGERYGWRPEQVLLVATGTRGAPCTAPCLGTSAVAADFAEKAVDIAIAAIAQARDSLQDASLGSGAAYLPRLPFNRRLLTRNLRAVTEWVGVPENEVLAPEGPVDPELTVVLLRDGKGKPLAALWSFAADPMFYEGNAISAGLPYYVEKEVQERLERPVAALYLPGCAGNVGYNFDLARTAKALASAITAVVLETPCDPDAKVAARREEVVLPIKDYSRFWDEAEVATKWPQAVDAYREEVSLLQAEGALAVPTAVQAMRLGGLGLVGLPGEPFVEFALAIEEHSPFKRTIVAANAGDSIGYIAAEQALRNGGQETWLARFAKVGRGAGEFLAAEASALLAEMA